ncbi:hypothetical protein [Rhizobium mayense]|uniref:Uncharacterized protein n=1 Tax=Rhizobium mayense TaxID=1312184 RepID=A0ABT7JN15_9HYPH|nr:hypothetical protein [Rhizobium mayense]MDL2397740.1 hypothetical protein [Rhizobium mayense]
MQYGLSYRAANGDGPINNISPEPINTNGQSEALGWVILQLLTTLRP